jgi:hypothetical protein
LLLLLSLTPESLEVHSRVHAAALQDSLLLLLLLHNEVCSKDTLLDLHWLNISSSSRNCWPIMLLLLLLLSVLLLLLLAVACCIAWVSWQWCINYSIIIITMLRC